MITLLARICKSNNIAHYYDNEFIYVNKDNISSISPDGHGFYILTMKSGEVFTLAMSRSDIVRALNE